MTLPNPPLMIITDRKLTRKPLIEVLAEIFAAGCNWILIREKDLTPHPLTSLVKESVNLAASYDATVSISGNVSIARDCGVQGVHLPQGQSVSKARSLLGEDVLLGVSTHSLNEASQAQAEGADYLTLSPIFPPISKKTTTMPLGLSELHQISQKISIPILALGGITPNNTLECLEAGAAGVAVLGAVMSSSNPSGIVAAYLDKLTISRRA